MARFKGPSSDSWFGTPAQSSSIPAKSSVQKDDTFTKTILPRVDWHSYSDSQTIWNIFQHDAVYLLRHWTNNSIEHVVNVATSQKWALLSLYKDILQLIRLPIICPLYPSFCIIVACIIRTLDAILSYHSSLKCYLT